MFPLLDRAAVVPAVVVNVVVVVVVVVGGSQDSCISIEIFKELHEKQNYSFTKE